MNEKYPIKAIVYIRRNSDGVIHSDSEEHSFHGDFVWSEGNFSCDCNRAIFFGAEDEESQMCGESDYSVKIVAKDNGRILYQDGKWEPEL